MTAQRVADPQGRDALEEKGPQRHQKRLDTRLEEVAKAVVGGYCQLQMPLKLALAVMETVAGHRLGTLEGGAGAPHLPTHPCLKVKGPSLAIMPRFGTVSCVVDQHRTPAT